jgi:6-phosphogluconolactonase
MGSGEGPSRRRFLSVAGAGAVAAALAGGGIAEARSASGDPDRRRHEREQPMSHSTHPESTPRPLYLGTYTSQSGGGKGIGLATYDPQSGRLTATGTVTGVADPSFLALSPSGRTLYAVDEQAEGAVTAVAIDGPGAPRVLGSRSTGGSGPCHLCVHPGGRHLLSANYDSGSVAVHPIAGDGSLGARTALVQHTGTGPDPDRQEGPHAHMVLTDPGGRYVLAVDLGNDSVYTYRLDTTAGTLHQVSRARTRPGAGPRHLAFHPSGRFAYLANELDDTVVVCAYDPATGRLTPGTPQATVPPGTPLPQRNYPAEVVVSADGRHVYLSNRGHDSIARFAVESSGAALRLLDTTPSGGTYPRHIALSPSGTLLLAANQTSGTVATFTVAPETGALTATGAHLAEPLAVCALPA